MAHGEIGVYNQREIREQQKLKKVKSMEIKDNAGKTVDFDFNNDGKIDGKELRIKVKCYDLKQNLQHENMQKLKKQDKLNKKIEKLKQQISAGKDVKSFFSTKTIAKMKKELAILEAKKEMIEKEFIAEEVFINDNFEDVINFAKEKYSTKKITEQELQEKIEIRAKEENTLNPYIEPQKKFTFIPHEKDSAREIINSHFADSIVPLPKTGTSEADYYDELATKAKNSIPMLEPISAMFQGINIKDLVKEVNETGVKNLSLVQIQKVIDMLNAVKNNPNAASFQSMLNDAISDTKEFYVLQKIRLAKSEEGEQESVQPEPTKNAANLPDQVNKLAEKQNISLPIQKTQQTAKEEEIQQRINNKLQENNSSEEEYYRKLLINVAGNLKETYMLTGIIPDANVYPFLKIAGDIGSTEKLTPEQIQLMTDMANKIKDRTEVKELRPLIEDAISNMEELAVLQKKNNLKV